MNWIFEAFSNVYKVAMMRNTDHPTHGAAVSEKPKPRHHGRLSRRS
jgi:hypothetical protein